MKRIFIRLSWYDFSFKGNLETEEIKKRGSRIIKMEPFGIGDCTIFEIDKLPDPFPENWNIETDFTFSDESN